MYVRSVTASGDDPSGSLPLFARLEAKKKEAAGQMAAVIRNLLEGLRVVSGLIYPVMPETAATMHKHLGLDPEKSFYLLKEIEKWPQIPDNASLPKGISLFPRIDPETILRTESADDGESSVTKTVSVPPIKEQIGFDDFSTIDLRAAKVIHAEKVPKADKLLKLEVDLGDHTRTVVAGIAKFYKPEELVGKSVVMLANLKPAKLMGVESKGMLLAAVEKSACSVAVLDRDMPPGTPLK